MIIYKTTNLINGKIYIGQDSKNNPKYLGSGDLLKKSIKKYGKENFIKEILCTCINQKDLDDKEKFFIKELDSFNMEIGYNIALGGRNGGSFGRKLSEEHKKKISESRIGIVFSEEHKNKLSKAHIGKVIGRETKEKMSNSQKLITHKPMSKETKEKISKIKTGKKLSNETKEKIRESHYGEKNHFFGKKHSDETLSKTRKPIIQLSIDGEIIKEWSGINEAAKSLNIKQSGISAVLCGKYKITHGFKFIYKNEQ